MHQGRGEGQRNLDNDGVTLDDIKRYCKYDRTDQCLSYLLKLPPAPVLSAAGYDHHAPSTAGAAHLKPPCSVGLSGLVDIVLPAFAAM